MTKFDMGHNNTVKVFALRLVVLELLPRLDACSRVES